MGQSNSTAHETSILKNSNKFIKNEILCTLQFECFSDATARMLVQRKDEDGKSTPLAAELPDRRIVILSTPGVIT